MAIAGPRPFFDHVTTDRYPRNPFDSAHVRPPSAVNAALSSASSSLLKSPPTTMPSDGLRNAIEKIPAPLSEWTRVAATINVLPESSDRRTRPAGAPIH